MLGVVNSNYEFIMVDVGMNGCVSDGGILSNSKFCQLLRPNGLHIHPAEVLPNSNKTAPFVCVVDDTFAISHNLLKPYSLNRINFKTKNFQLSSKSHTLDSGKCFWNFKFKIWNISKKY